jgi:hypothetical protein
MQDEEATYISHGQAHFRNNRHFNEWSSNRIDQLKCWAIRRSPPTMIYARVSQSKIGMDMQLLQNKLDENKAT